MKITQEKIVDRQGRSGILPFFPYSFKAIGSRFYFEVQKTMVGDYAQSWLT